MTQAFIEQGQNFLAHYGVMGMHWGVRKDRFKASLAARRERRLNPVISTDKKAANKIQTRSKTLGLQSLSNAQIKKLITRQQLEMQYRQMNPNAMTLGRNFVRNFTGTANDVTNAINTTSRTVKTVRTLHKVAKVAAAVA